MVKVEVFLKELKKTCENFKDSDEDDEEGYDWEFIIYKCLSLSKEDEDFDRWKRFSIRLPPSKWNVKLTKNLEKYFESRDRIKLIKLVAKFLLGDFTIIRSFHRSTIIKASLEKGSVLYGDIVIHRTIRKELESEGLNYELLLTSRDFYDKDFNHDVEENTNLSSEYVSSKVFNKSTVEEFIIKEDELFSPNLKVFEPLNQQGIQIKISSDNKFNIAEISNIINNENQQENERDNESFEIFRMNCERFKNIIEKKLVNNPSWTDIYLEWLKSKIIKEDNIENSINFEDFDPYENIKDIKWYLDYDLNACIELLQMDVIKREQCLKEIIKMSTGLLYESKNDYSNMLKNSKNYITVKKQIKISEKTIFIFGLICISSSTSYKNDINSYTLRILTITDSDSIIENIRQSYFSGINEYPELAAEIKQLVTDKENLKNCINVTKDNKYIPSCSISQKVYKKCFIHLISCDKPERCKTSKNEHELNLQKFDLDRSKLSFNHKSKMQYYFAASEEIALEKEVEITFKINQKANYKNRISIKEIHNFYFGPIYSLINFNRKQYFFAYNAYLFSRPNLLQNSLILIDQYKIETDTESNYGFFNSLELFINSMPDPLIIPQKYVLIQYFSLETDYYYINYLCIKKILSNMSYLLIKNLLNLKKNIYFSEGIKRALVICLIYDNELALNILTPCEDSQFIIEILTDYIEILNDYIEKKKYYSENNTSIFFSFLINKIGNQEKKEIIDKLINSSKISIDIKTSLIEKFKDILNDEIYNSYQKNIKDTYIQDMKVDNVSEIIKSLELSRNYNIFGENNINEIRPKISEKIRSEFLYKRLSDWFPYYSSWPDWNFTVRFDSVYNKNEKKSKNEKIFNGKQTNQVLEMLKLFKELKLIELFNQTLGIISNEISISEILSFCTLSNEQLIKFYDQKLHRIKDQGFEKILNCITSDYEKITEETKNEICSNIVEILMKYPRSNQKLIIAKIQILDNDELKSKYLQKFKSVIDELISDEDIIIELISNLSKIEGNEFINSLRYTVLSSLPEPSEESLKKNIFMNPSDNFFWYHLINNSESKFDNNYFNRIIDYLKNICESIKNSTILVKDLSLYKNLSTNKKDIFLKYLKFAAPLINIQLNYLDNQLENHMKKLKPLMEIRDFLSVFIEEYCKKLPIYATLKPKLENFQKNFIEKNISEINYPDIFSDSKEFYSEASLLCGSSLFRINYFKSKSNEISEQNINEVIRNLKSKMKETLKTIILKIEEYKIQNFFKEFKEKKITSIKKEENLIMSMLEENQCKIIIKYFKTISDSVGYLKFAYNILKLSTVLKYECIDLKEKVNIVESSKLNNNVIKVYIKDLENFNNYMKNEIKKQNINDGKLFGIISQSVDLINFISQLTSDKLETLQDSTDEYEENQDIKNSDVLSLIRCWRFYQDITIQERTLSEFLDSLSQEIINPQYRSILEDFKICNTRLSSFQDIFANLSNRQDAKKKLILKLLEQSSAELIFCKETKDFNLNIQVSKQNSNSKVSISYSTLLELKERASLKYFMNITNTENKENMKNEIESCDQFIKFVNFLSNVVSKSNFLYYTLCRQSIETKIILECNQSNYEDIENYSKKLDVLENDLTESLQRICETNFYLNFLSEKQYLQMVKYISEPENNEMERKLIPLFNFMEKAFLPPDKISNILELSNDEKLMSISNYLNSLPSQEKFIRFPEREIQKNFRFEAGEIIACESNRFFEGIFRIYFNYGNNYPNLNQILFCHDKLRWQETKNFLNRCFQSKETLYTIVYPELLSQTHLMQFKLHLHSLLKENSERTFYLGIISTSTKFDLFNIFKGFNLRVNWLRYFDSLSEKDLASLIKYLARSTTIYSSSIVGLGKTTLIKQKSSTENKKYVEITLYDGLNDYILYKKLSKIQSSDPILLHIKLNFNEPAESIKIFLFSIIMFRKYHTHKGDFFINERSEICIEIGNTFYSILESLPFLSYLKQFYIEKLDLNNLTIDYKINYVSDYLNLLDKSRIDNEDIFFNKEKYENQEIQKEDILKLMNKYFFEKSTLGISFYQFKVFINCLFTLFTDLEKSLFTKSAITYQISILSNSIKNSLINDLRQLRSVIVSTIIHSTEEFTKISISNAYKNQDQSLKFSSNDELNLSKFPQISQWEVGDHFTILFMDDGVMMSVYRSLENVNINFKRYMHYNILIAEKTNINEQQIINDLNKNSLKIENYEQMSHEDLLRKMVNFYHRSTFKEIYKLPSKEIEIQKEKEIQRILKIRYVLTSDNFLKMNLIYLRASSNIPIIIMGETGCGKTKLISFFVREILKEELKVINVHAGKSLEDIISEIKKLNEELIERNKKYPDLEWENEKLKSHSSNNPDNQKLKDQLRDSELELLKYKGRYWVFFDEFNTSDAVGLITDIICDKKLDDIELCDDFVFIGACNPYRLKKENSDYTENVGIKKASQYYSKHSNLVHVVKPLPYKALEFVWDYGQLSKEDTKKYVLQMLSEVSISIREKLCSLITEIHEFFKEKEDSSSVSLRDVKRFRKLFKWFKGSIEKRNELTSAEDQEKKEYFKLLTKFNDLVPAMLALFHCYYLRISSIQMRSNFQNLLNLRLEELNITLDEAMNIIINEKNDFMNRMTIPKGIAKNSALSENIFAIIPCLQLRMPIFICGKPGCSKSLAVQLISSNLGPTSHSKDSYFKSLSQIQIVSFQGSESCTSEGIIKVFERAEKINIDKRVIPVVLFDEIGLAEISKHNPLKVLHSLLEKDSGKDSDRIGFIGISNWRLDASKMNRALYLARPDPDSEELSDTAVQIFESVTGKNTESTIYTQYINSLAYSYFHLKEVLRNTSNSDFYGLRDFYQLIKQVSNEISANRPDQEGLLKFINISIQRNFGGKIIDSDSKSLSTIEIIKNHFCQKLVEATSFFNIENCSSIEMIEMNLKQDSRYLMIITSKSLCSLVIESILKEQIEDFKVLIGGGFKDDKNQEEEAFRQLSSIIRDLEYGIPLIFHDMDFIYSSLYDLFNQNFSRDGDKDYCRIALGAFFNPRCSVHRNFRAVVIMNDDDYSLKRADAPFLNRFEKHYIRINDIMADEKYRKISEQLKNWINQIFDISIKEKVKILSVIPTFSDETLYFLTKATEEETNKELDLNEILRRTKTKILEMSSIDITILCTSSRLEKEEKDFIIDEWKKKNNLKLEERLITLKDSEEKNLLVMTYDKKSISKIIEIFGKSLKIMQLSLIKSEQELDKFLNSFVESSDAETLLLEFDYSKEYSQLYFIANRIESTLSKSLKRKKCCIILSMSRNDKTRDSVIYLKNWKCIFYDYLYDFNIEINDELLKADVLNLLDLTKICQFEDIVSDNLFDAFSCIDYKFNKTHDRVEINSHISKTCAMLKNDEYLFSCLSSKVLQIISVEENKDTSWTKKIFEERSIVDDARNFEECIILYSRQQILKYCALLIHSIELENGFSFMNNSLDDFFYQRLKIIWQKKLDGRTVMTQKRFTLMKPTLIVNGLIGIIIPFIISEVKLLESFFERQIKQFMKIDYRCENDLASFIKKNKMTLEFYELLDSEELQKIYFKDLIKVLLIPDQANDWMIDKIIYFIFECKSKFYPSIQKKLIVINQNKKIIESMNKICNLITDHGLSEMISNDTINKLVVDSENGMHELLKLLLESSLESILDLQHDAKKHDNYLTSLIKIKSLLIKAGMKIKANIFEKLNFWINLLNYCDEKQEISKLIELIDGKDYLKNQSFQNFIHGIIKSSTKNEQYFKFYFNEMIMQQQAYDLDKIIEQIESPNAWKYSSNTIKSIFKSLRIKEEIQSFESNQDKIELFPSSFEKIDKNIDILRRNIFSVLLMYEIQKIELRVVTDNLFERFKSYQLILDSENIKLNNISKLAALSRIKCILGYFCTLINKKNLTLSEGNFIKELVTYFNETKLEIYILFIIKTLQSQEDLSLKDVKELFKRFQINSLLDSEHDITEERKIFPYYDDGDALFEKITQYIRDFRNNSEDIIQIIKTSCKDSKKRFTILTAFLNECYSKYQSTESPNEFPKIWIEANKDKFAEQGKFFVELLSRLINNFPKNSPLHLNFMEKEGSTENIKKMSLCYYSCFTIAFSAEINPISSVIIDPNGNPTIDLLASSYIIGVESNYLYEFHLDIRNNFESMKNMRAYNAGAQPGGFVVCSNDCNLIYVIENCGAPVVESICTNCYKKIGGKNHQLCETERGHRYLTIEEAKKINESVILQGESNPEKGYVFNIASMHNMVRKLSNPLSYSTLKLFCNSFFAYLYYSDLIDQNALKSHILYKGKQLEQDINEKIASSFQILFDHFKINTYCQILSIISEYPNFLRNYPLIFSVYTDRNNFEKEFENYFFDTDSIHNIQSSYKKKISEKSNSTKNLIEEIEIPESNIATYFNLIGKPSVENFKREFELVTKEKNLKFLRFFFDNEKNIKSLDYLYPILEFSNYAVQKFSLTLSRKDSESKTIKEFCDKDEKLKSLFNNFVKSWESLDLELQYECHLISKDKKININENTKLCYILCDKHSIEVLQVAAAISTLVNIHNSVVSLKKLNQNRKNNKTTYNSQLILNNIRKEDIIKFPSDLDEMISKNSINHISYGRGKEIVYNFDLLDDYIKEFVMSKNIIDENTISFINYSFELHFIHSDLITNLRERVPQENLNVDDERKIRNLINNRTNGTLKNEIPTNLINYYHILDILMLYLKNAEANNESKIKDILSSMVERFSPLKAGDFEISDEIGNLEIKFINHIYEMIEERVYEAKIQDIFDIYKNELSDEDKAQLKNFIVFTLENLNYHTIEEFSNGLKRFILRNMNSELSINHPLAYYILDYYFNINLTDTCEILKPQFPEQILMSQIISCINTIDSIIKEYSPEKNDLSIIQKIRNASFQEDLTQNHYNKFKEIAEKNISKSLNLLQLLKQIYDYLNRLLKVTPDQDLKNQKNIKYIIDLHGSSIDQPQLNFDELFSDIKFAHITNLLEKIEVDIYPEVSKSINDLYKEEFKQTGKNKKLLKNKINILKSSIEDNFPKSATSADPSIFQELINALKRISCRVLTENIDENIAIKQYIQFEIYWTLKCVRSFKNKDKTPWKYISEIFPQEFQLKKTLSLIRELEDAIEKNIKSNSKNAKGKR